MEIKFNNIHFNGAKQKKTVNREQDSKQESESVNGTLSGSEIPFCAIQGVKRKDKDILEEKIKLERSIKNMMMQEVNNTSQKEISKEIFQKHAKAIKTKMKRNLGSFKDLPSLDENALFTIFMMSIEPILIKMQQECDAEIALRRSKDKTDYKLLYKLDSAVLSDNMDLDTIYKEHYSPLTEFSSISEANTVFPQIKTPPRPEDNIGKKIANIFDKSFIEEFDDLRNNSSIKVSQKLFREKFGAIIKDLAAETKCDEHFLSDKLIVSTYKALLNKYNSNEGMSLFNAQVKRPKNLISQDEVKMLSVDYDKFVLYVLSQQYVEGKNLLDITYNEGNVSISPKTLSNTEYKFEKPNEKIRAFIKEANKIKQLERSYDTQTNEQLSDRLAYYGNQKIADNDVILEHLIEFSSSYFTEEDKKPLIRFLRVLDDISDGNITEEKGAEIIKKENLLPHGSNKLNEAEKERMMEDLKQAQKINSQFNSYIKTFDYYLSLLYSYGLQEVASECMAYKPKDANSSKEMSDRIIDIIKKGINDNDNNELENPNKTGLELKYFNKYQSYKTNQNNGELLEQAEKYATDEFGNIDEIKAGCYLSASELIADYPKCVMQYEEAEAEIVKYICTQINDKNKAIELLVKYNEYKLLPPKEQLRISTLLKTFDMYNSQEEKDLVKIFINDIYIKNTTHIDTLITRDSSKTLESTFEPSAKQAIIDEKRFPLCIDYFEAFEKYMARLAQSKEEYGIQSLGNNNKTLRKMYKQEVKIPMEERIYSTDTMYKFDAYNSGRHKEKNTKA